MVEIATRGSATSTVWLSKAQIDRYYGLLYKMKQSDVRRLIIRMLTMDILEETFVQAARNVSVYL